VKKIGEDVHRELRRHGPAAGMSELVGAWPEAVGAAVARHAWPARLARDGTLHVNTSSSAWAFELGHLEHEIMPRLRRLVGDLAPPRLRFAPGRLPEDPEDEAQGQRERPPEPSPEARSEAERLAASIEDEDLRKLVAKAAAASLARNADDRSL
jgi:hypothetical protein